MSILLKCLEPRPMAQMRLICVPHAGAGASIYRSWLQYIPTSIELYALQLPAREERLKEQALLEWEGVDTALESIAQSQTAMKTVIFGHSLGSLIALLLARHIANNSKASLEHLFVSAFPWPGSFKGADKQIFETDESFLEYMEQRFGSLGEGMQHAEIREMILPTLKNDIRLLSAYQHSQSGALKTPITTFYGEDDPSSDVDKLLQWQKETSNEFSLCPIKSGHLYHVEMPDILIPKILEKL